MDGEEHTIVWFRILDNGEMRWPLFKPLQELLQNLMVSTNYWWSKSTVILDAHMWALGRSLLYKYTHVHTCTKSNHCSWDEHHPAGQARLECSTVRIQHAEDDIDHQGNDEGLPRWSFVSPQSKERWSDELPKAICSNNPTEKFRRCILVVNLWDAVWAEKLCL